MADIKTSLRELSVALKIGINLQKIIISNEELTKPDTFMYYAISIVRGAENATTIRDIVEFSSEYKNIISNGFKLADEICRHFTFNSNDRIVWKGSNIQSGDPIDLSIGAYDFSLKESSFILENMGLYKFLSLLTNKKHDRGLNVFEKFANKEYNDWFQYTWERMCSSDNWECVNIDKNYFSRIDITGEMVYLNYDGREVSQIPKDIKTVSEYTKFTSSVTREKVFSKWIRECIERDSRYNELKKICSEVAGSKVSDYINNNLNPTGIARLLQIRSKEYYYAKSTDKETTILYVPNYESYAKEFNIDSVTYGVPKSQLNLYTTITNTSTGKKLTMRNECRFSHGQFNGTPEAKMYYDYGSDLSIIYQPIY